MTEGPWMQDHWVILDRPGERSRQTERICPVDGCENPSFCGPRLAGICHGHYWRWRRAGEPEISDWASLTHQPIAQKAVRGLKRAFDFTVLPAAAVNEIRYVVGFKFSRGEWTPNRLVRDVLELLAEALVTFDAASFTEREAAEWITLIRKISGAGDARFAHTQRPYLNTFFRTLSRAYIADPWADDVWLWRGVFEEILGTEDFYGGNIRWSAITQKWLRDATKAYARHCLQGKTRGWSTLLTWSRAMGRLSEFLDERDITEPGQLDRQMFLLFLEKNQAGGSKNRMQEINVTAALLTELKLGDYLPGLGSELFLRGNENIVEKTRSPRPWPKDIVFQIEKKIIDNPEVDPQLSLMVRFCRWGGPRVSELVVLPLESLLENGSGGYWIEYFQLKNKSWRRFPIPKSLGAVLVEQRKNVLLQYGPTAKYMFPQAASSNPVTGVTRAWSTSGISSAFADLFVAQGIVQSSITGELVTGSSIHRFRHTIGTDLLNAGWTEAEVQAFLGHSSPTMVSAYAQISDTTLSQKSETYFEQAISANPESGEVAVRAHRVVERLRQKYTAVTGVGFCALPAAQKCSVRDNPCLSCSFFRTGDGEFDEAHGTFRRQLQLTIADAREEGSSGSNAIAEINERILAKLDAVAPEIESV